MTRDEMKTFLLRVGLSDRPYVCVPGTMPQVIIDTYLDILVWSAANVPDFDLLDDREKVEACEERMRGHSCVTGHGHVSCCPAYDTEKWAFVVKNIEGINHVLRYWNDYGKGTSRPHVGALYMWAEHFYMAIGWALQYNLNKLLQTMPEFEE